MKELDRGGNNHPNADQQDRSLPLLCLVIHFLKKHQQIKFRIAVHYCANQETKLGGIFIIQTQIAGSSRLARDPKLHRPEDLTMSE